MSGARGLRLGVSLVLLVAATAAAEGPARKDDLQGEQRRLQQTQKQLQEERAKAADARARETSVLAELEQTERRLADKRREVARLDARARKAQTELTTIQGDIRGLEGRRAAQQELLARRLRALYKVHAAGGVLPLLLAADDPVARVGALRSLASVAALDARLIREYRVTSDGLEERKGREEVRQRELAGLRAEASREQTEADAEAAKRRGLLAKVRDERAYHERMVGELSEATRKLEALLRDLQARQRRLARVPPPKPGVEPPTPAVGFGTLRGRLPWPTEGKIVTAFGAQRHPRFGTRIFKNGVDIEADEGTAVTAVYPGQVIYTGWFKGYGNIIILDHDGEYYTLYAHIAEASVKEGDDVRQGQRIGSVGDTGSLAGAKLYFEVRHQGRPLDPEQWLRQRG